jgi:methionyl-tRNA synthetase
MSQKPTIVYDDFAKLDIRVVTVLEASAIEGADKLLKLVLDAGELGQRTVASGIKPWYTPEEMVGKQLLYLANLEPRTIRGVESQGMIIAAGGVDAALVHPDKLVANGEIVR